MSGNPNWNPPLQTSSVRFPRKAVETPQIPPNTTARPRPGTPFQPIYPNPITQIPAITPALTGSGDILDKLYVLNNGTGDALPYNVTRQTMRGVPIPTVITVATSERYIVFGVDFPYQMSGTDHFVFTFTNVNTTEQTIKNYQQAAQYLVGGIEPGVLYTLTVSPYVNGITYPASASVGPFSITAISEKNVELQGVTLSGGDRSAYISFTGANPAPPIAMAVTSIAIDDNFTNAQLRCNVISPSGVVNAGYVFISNLTNGSSYIFTVTPYRVTDGIYEYGRPTNLPPYIPGPPSELYVNSITANTTTAFLSTCYDTIIHPTPVSNTVTLYNSTFTTICSLVSGPSNVVQDLSQVYAGFTTLSSLFTPADITYLKSTVSANPGIIQADITDNKGLWYSFPLATVSGGGIGYVFENSNFTKTQSLYATASSSYTLLFRYVNLGTQICSAVYSPPQTEFIYRNLFQSNYTITGQNYANGLPSLRTTYSTIAVGNPLVPINITGVSGNHIVSISFTGYDPTLTNAGPKPTFFSYSDNFGNTYTTLNSNIVINGLTNSSSYTFRIQGFANGVYGNAAQYTINPGVRPPPNLTLLSISNYDVTLSFSPALGGADYYAVGTQNGLAQSVSAFPYKIQNLSADVSYFFGAVSFAYNAAVYSVSSSVSANLIQEVSSSYAQFLISPSGFPYASNIQQGLTEFVPYLYTIAASGESPAPATVDVTNFVPANIFPVGTALYASNSISTIALVQSGISAGIAYTVTTSGRISYTLTSIGISGGYYVLNGGPSSLTSVLSGQILSLSVTPISNSLTFPITSVAPIYNSSGNITAYNVQNSNFLKSKTTFSGATVYRTSISALIPFYDGMTPTTYVGTVSSAVYAPVVPPIFVGPPSTVIFTSSGYSSQEIFLNVAVSGYVIPSFYAYTELSGQVAPGTSVSSQIVFSGLTNGSSYTFSVRAFGNQVFSVCAARTIRFDLCTNAPRNVVAAFSNVTPTISYDVSVPAADSYVSDLFDGNTLIATVTSLSGGLFNFPFPVAPRTRYTFRTYGIRNGISSTPCNIFPRISGRPEIPVLKSSLLTSGQIVFNWSSGNPDYSEKFRITEYLSNNGVYPTGGVWSNISGFTYTVSAVVTTSGSQGYVATEWIESSLGYAAFVLTNSYPNFTNTISGKYLSNQIYLTVQQSGLSYTFPLTNIAPYNSTSNIYTNPNYPKEATDIFNAALSLSVTYSYGTGPFNYGKYFYTLDSFANQVFGLSAEIPAQMFVQPVNGVPSVSITGTTGTTATVSFAQTAITGSTYTVTNNYGTSISTSPYVFTNLSTGQPYAFTVVVSNGAFISISSESSIPIYVGPPSAPLVSTSYYGQTSTVYVTDTTLSLASVFFDSGKQGTGTNIATPSHTNVIQQVSGGFWVGAGGNGNIKDTSTGFVSSDVNIGSAVYCNDGVANAMYQFRVTPSTGTIAVSLSAYSLFISGTSLAVSNGSTQVYSGTITTSSYPIQFISRSVAFGIQSGLSSFFYTSVPASSDLLTISLGGAASFSDYRVYSFNNAGVQASSYTISDQFNTVYSPSLAYTAYSLSGITYAYNLFNVSQNVNLTLSVRPFGNGVFGPVASASLYIYTEGPGTPFIASLVDTSATVTVGAIPTTALPVESYSLIQYENGNAISTQTQPAVAYSPYAVPGLNLWLDAADTTTITSNATTGITRWSDKSLNGYNAVPAMFTIPGCVVWIAPGTYYSEFGVVTSVTNFGTAGGALTAAGGTVTKVGVAYPSSAYLSFAQGSSMTLPPITYTQTSRTVIAVVKVGEPGGVRQFLTATSGTSNIQFYSFNNNLELNLPGYRLQRAASPQDFFNSTSILSATSTTADRGIYVNGIAQTTDINDTGAYSTGTTTTQLIGNGGAAFDLYEMLVFDGALTQTQRQQVEGYLAYKYNLQSKLPSSHPYSTTPFQRVFTATITPPNITTTTQNGLNAIATNTGILTINNFNWTSYSTVFFVAKTPNISYFAGTAASSYVGYIGTFNWGLFATGAGNFNDSVLPLGTQVIPSNQWCLFSIGYGGGTQATNYAVNGTPRSTTTAAPGPYTSTTAPLWLSAWGPGGIYGGDNITIGEVIHYNRSITTQERQNIESYLANKWGLELGLPPNTVPGLTLWLDATDPNATGVVAPGGTAITSWKDKSGLGSNATATGTLTISSTGLNGRPTVNFNGSSWFTGSTANTSATMTAFVVLQHPVVTTASYIRFLSMAPATTLDQDVGGILAELTTGTNLVVANGNAQSGFPQPNNTPYIMDFQANGTNLISYLNGTAQAGQASTTNFNITRYRVGSMVGNDTNVYTGYISEVLIYNTALTTVQRQNIESYLANKWGLTVTPASPPRIPAAPAGPTTYTFRYPNLSNHFNYYFKAYTTRLGISSQNQPVSTPEREAGRPYPFSGLVGSLINPDATRGNYTLSATLNVGSNSNANMSVFVYSGTSLIASQTIASTNAQTYSFTVSGGAVYTLSTTALMNSVTLSGPTTTVSAVPFAPLAAVITISTANLGLTYRGIINVTTPSPTTGVTYFYAFSSNNGTTVTDLSQTNTFGATYGLSYVGYVYSCNVAPLNLLSTASVATSTCNIFIPEPVGAAVTYTGTAITVTWSTDPIYSFTIREKDGKLPTQSNIPKNLPRAVFTGIQESNYTFQIATQSSTSATSPSIIYSTFLTTPSVTLTTLSASPVTIDYAGTNITLGWKDLGANYIYSVSQTRGPPLAIPFINPGQNAVTIPNVVMYNTYQFVVGTLLNGISGSNTTSPTVTLSTVALTNVSQSIFGNKYTISWSPYPFTASVTDYIVTELSSGLSFSTRTTVSTLTLGTNLSFYTFQVNASYKGIRGPATTLSSVYTYVNATQSVPTTTYSNSNITITWSAAPQPDGNSNPDIYFVYDTIGRTLSSNVLGTNNSVVLTASVGLSYQFTVTSLYKGLSSPPSIPGPEIRVFTPPPSGVTITNVGSNLFISWTPSTLSATYAIRQTLGPPVISTTAFSNVGLDTSYTTNAVTTPSDRLFYNFAVIALSNGLSSEIATTTDGGFVYTYPPSSVFIYYSNTQLFARWTVDSRQPNAQFTVVGVDTVGNNIGGLTSAAGASSLAFQKGTSNATYTARVTATNNGLLQTDTAVSSTNSVTLFTAQPILNGIGFNGNYAITVNMSSGPYTNNDSRLRNADTYTLTEINNNFFPSASAWTFPASSVFTIPTLGTRGVTYNFELVATLCGLASAIASPSGTIRLDLITNPVPADSVVATYSGTTVTVTWGKAAQNNVNNPDSPPNGGYTIYVSSLTFPYTTQYKLGTSILFPGEAGETYQFSIEATNNNVGSALVTDASAIVTLYKPVVDFLSVTNSGALDGTRYYAKMILNWLLDDVNASGAVYTAISRNRSTGRIEQTLSTTTNTLMFDGSLDTSYVLSVTGRFKGIDGDSTSIEISNARPILTVEPLFNLGNIITVNYSANQAFSSFNTSANPVGGNGQVLSNIVTTSSFSSWRVITSTTAFTYNVSTTAFFNGLPSVTIGRRIELIEPQAPESIEFSYNNTLVTVSWASVAANASTYAFTAYDMSADPPILTSSQPGLLTRTATFTGIVGHSYNVSAFAVSATNVTSQGKGLTATIEIPTAPPGPLTLSNVGTRVSVTWTADSSYGYSFYVSNVAQRGTVIYSNLFALPGDTFTGVVGETYSVSLFRTSASNVTSRDSIVSSWKVYQPSIPFVVFTNVGQDNTVTWPQDVGGSNCVFSLRDNYLYSNLLFPDPTNYTTPSNGWVNDTTFVPTRIPGLRLWLDAADPTKIGRVSGAITTWTDKSTNAYVATKIEGTIGSTTLNNLSALNMGYNRMSIPSFVWSNVFTAFVVAKAKSGSCMTGLTNPALSGSDAWLNYFQTGNWALLYVGPSFGTTDPDYRQPNGDPASLPGTENWFIFTIGYNGGTTAQNFTFNGSPCNSNPGTAAGSSSKTGTYYINGLNTGGYGDCDIAEIIHYNSNLNSLQMTQVTTYLANKWGLTMNPVFKQGPALIHAPNYSATVSGTYTQIGSYVSYVVLSNEAYTTGKSYIYTVIPSWNGTNGNAVTTNTTNPIALYKPTAPGNGILNVVGQGSTFTVNWQSSVIYTTPPVTIPSYFVEVSPKISNTAYPYKSFNVVGNTQTVTGFDASASTLSISVTAVNPVGYSNAIYGFPSSADYIVPSGTTVSIAQSTLCAETLTVTVPQQTAGTNYMWLIAIGYGQTNAGIPSTTNVQSNRLNYNSASRNYTLNVSLGFSYTISAYLTTGSISINDGPNGSSPANGNPFPVPTLPVTASGITVTHDACSVALSWPPVVGAEYYNVYFNPQTAGKFGRANIPANCNSITILSNGPDQFGANSNYSYIIQAFTTSANRFFGSGVRGYNLQSADSVSPVVTMFVPTNPAASELTFSQQLSNLTISWPALTNYPQDNEADIGTPLYTISAGTLTCNATTGRTATFAITPGTNYSIRLNTQYKGLWGVTPTIASYQTTAPNITAGPTLTDTGSATIRVTATAATVGFWYLLDGTTETLMNSPAGVASNAITSYTFPTVKATRYTRQVKFVTQDTGLSVTRTTNTVDTPDLVVSRPTTADAGASRRFTITLAHTGTATGAILWNVTTPMGTSFVSGDKAANPSVLTYQFTNAAWTSGLTATFTSIDLSNDGFTFPYATTATTKQYTTPLNTILTVGGGATASTVTVTVIGGGGGTATWNNTRGGDGAVATYTFEGVTPTSTISYFVGSGGVAASYPGGGWNSYVTIGGITIYAGGGGGGAYGEMGVGLGGGGTGGANGYPGNVGGIGNTSAVLNGTRIGTYGIGGGGNGNSGIVVITMTDIPTYTAPNLAITGVTLTNVAGNLTLAAANAYNVTWTYPSYTTLGGGGSTTTTALSVNYGAMSATGTVYSPNAALTLAYNGYTNSTSLPSFTAPNFGFGTITLADPNVGTTIMRLTATYGTYTAGTTGGSTTPQWTFPSTTSNGGPYTQLSASAPFTSPNSPATLDYSNTSSGSSYAIAANVIRLSYQGISILYGSLLTASTPTIGINTPVPVTYNGIFVTLTPTSIGNLLGNWTVSSAVSGLVGPVNYAYQINPLLTGSNDLTTGNIASINLVGGSWSQVNTLFAGANGIQGTLYTNGQTATYSNGGTIPATFQFLMYFKNTAYQDSDTLGSLNFATSGGNYSIVTSYIKPQGGQYGPTNLTTVIQNPTGTILATLSSASYPPPNNATFVMALYFQVVRTANSLSFYSSAVSLNAAIASTPNVYSGLTTVDKLVIGFNTNGGGSLAQAYVKNFFVGTPSVINNVATTALTYYADPISYTPFTIPLQFSYGGLKSLVVNTTINFTNVSGTITALTLAYGSGTPPNGINSSFTASFTPNATSNVVVLYDTPPESGSVDGRYNGQTQTLTSGLTTTFNNGTLNPNIVYRVGAAQSINGNRGNVFYKNIVYPAAVTDLRWGSARGSSDRSLETPTTIWISWTPITVDASIAGRFTYTLYSSTTVPSAPSLTQPAGATGYAGYPSTQSNIQILVASGLQTYFIITKYTDPGGYSYYSAAPANPVRFTYGSFTCVAGTNTFNVQNANTYANITVVGGGGGSGNGGNAGYSPGGGGGGGIITVNGYRGIQYNDSIFMAAGGGGGNAVSASSGGQGGSANGVAGNLGRAGGTGVNNNPARGTGIGGGGGARLWSS